MENKRPSIVWLRNGRKVRQVEGTTKIENTLSKRIYVLKIDSRTDELYLEEFEDEFHFNFKIYGMESKLIDHIMKTFNNTNSNLGILFNGVKGTGKTITAKILANKMNLPVIIINEPYSGIPEFVAKIESDVILFFDEYEKTFDKNSSEDKDILSIMDGIFNNQYRRIFFLTTNKEYINDNMLGRPSRIRYRKIFGNLQPEVIKEYLEDNLQKKEYTKDIMEFIDSLAISTIDILKAVVEELNIHDIPISEWKSFFNVEAAKYSWNCIVKDSDDIEDSANYNTTKFLEEVNKLGTVDTDCDGEEYIVRYPDIHAYCRRENTNSDVRYLQAGELFGSGGVIIEPLNEHNILVTEDEYGTRFYIKVLNIETSPSLYRGALVY